MKKMYIGVLAITIIGLLLASGCTSSSSLQQVKAGDIVSMSTPQTCNGNLVVRKVFVTGDGIDEDKGTGFSYTCFKIDEPLVGSSAIWSGFKTNVIKAKVIGQISQDSRNYLGI